MNSGTQFRLRAEYAAYLVHRVSGLLLVLFLPFHFLVLGTAIEADGTFDSLIRWSDNWMVKLVEAGLFALLVVHLSGGARILVLEFFDEHPAQPSVAAFHRFLARFQSATRAYAKRQQTCYRSSKVLRPLLL